jgi:hypothetical protein
MNEYYYGSAVELLLQYKTEVFRNKHIAVATAYIKSDMQKVAGLNPAFCSDKSAINRLS